MKQNNLNTEHRREAFAALKDTTELFTLMVRKHISFHDPAVLNVYEKFKEAFVDYLLARKRENPEHKERHHSLLKEIGLDFGEAEMLRIMWDIMDMMAKKLAKQESGDGSATSNVVTEIHQQIHGAVGPETGIQE